MGEPTNYGLRKRLNNKVGYRSVDSQNEIICFKVQVHHQEYRELLVVRNVSSIVKHKLFHFVKPISLGRVSMIPKLHDDS